MRVSSSSSTSTLLNPTGSVACRCSTQMQHPYHLDPITVLDYHNDPELLILRYHISRSASHNSVDESDPYLHPQAGLVNNDFSIPQH